MNILAIGAHPDDIEIGCGGTLIKYAQAGHSVNFLVLTDGSFGGDPGTRKREQEEVIRYMGAKEIFWGAFRDTELKDNRQLISRIDEVISKVNPDTVFINYYEDGHQDHRAASEAGISAARYVKEVLFYEVPTTQRFEPDIFVDIQEVMEKKSKLLELHASQFDKTRVKDLTIIESSNACAIFRGYQGRVKFAEGFKALRVLKDIR